MDKQLIVLIAFVLAGLLLLGCTGGAPSSGYSTPSVPVPSAYPPAGGVYPVSGSSLPADINNDTGINDSISDLNAVDNASSP
jgi:hypothetical protein